MATGRLGTADLAATTNTTVYACPVTTFTVASVSICNRTSGTITIRLALADTSTPAADEYLEYDVQILANGVLERTGIVINAGNQLVAYASDVGVSVVVMGIETPTV
jgi:hypothetical protein